MATNQINTIIVLRNDSTTDWAASDYILLSGEVGVGYMTRTIENDDGSATEKQVPIIKVGDGVNKWTDLPQAEGVFENDVILTYNFGRHTTSNGFVNAGGTGMTTSEWIIDALSVTQNPTVTYPNASINSATFVTSTTEVGGTISAVKWDGTFSAGSYTWGPATGLTANDTAWELKSGSTVIGSSIDGTYTLPSNMYVGDSAVTFAITGTVTLDASNAAIPLNNVGAGVASLKITGWDKAGTTTKSVSKTASVTGYRKPFWAVLDTAEALAVNASGNVDTTQLTSAIIRGLEKSGNSTGGLPTSLAVPAGSQQVIFAAKAGVKNTLTATDDNAMNAGVTFTKVASAVQVEGCRAGYDATAYDVWSVNWPGGIDSAKQLTLKWV